MRHAGILERAYSLFKSFLRVCDPLIRALGCTRVEKALLAFERRLKDLMFDCRVGGAWPGVP